ncbi:MAG: hypothetical protein QXN17_07080 [Nitrososphaerota archaeon]
MNSRRKPLSCSHIDIAFNVYDKTSKKFLGVPEKHGVIKSLSLCHVISNLRW